MIVKFFNIDPILTDALSAVSASAGFSTVENDFAFIDDNGLVKRAGIRPGYPFELLSVGITVPHGLIQGETATVLQCSMADFTRLDFYSDLVPFIPSEDALQYVFRTPNTATLGAYNLGKFNVVGSLSTIGLPAELEGVQLPVTIFCKVNIDSRAVVEAV